jgi:hypothetical protein
MKAVLYLVTPLSILLFFSCSNNGNSVYKKGLFLIEEYKAEIDNLKTDSAKQAYWKNLRFLDQQVLIRNYSDSTQALRDSVAIDNMIRSTIMLETHGNSMGLNERSVPLLIFIHNYISKANKNYWANILLLDSLKLIDDIGGGFPAYPLEGLSDLYMISFFQPDSLYPYILGKYKQHLEKPSAEKLSEIYYEHKQLIKQKNTDIIGTWVEKPFFDMELESSITIVKKEDGNYYYESGTHDFKYPSKLNKKQNKFYFEDDVLGWYLQIEDNGYLTLRYQTDKIKIEFPIYKQK